MNIILSTDFLHIEDTPQKKIVSDLVKDLESFTRLKARKVSLSALWDEKPPQGVEGQGLHVYLTDVRSSNCLAIPVAKRTQVGAHTFLYANYHSSARFRHEYCEKCGKSSYASPFVRWRW